MQSSPALERGPTGMCARAEIRIGVVGAGGGGLAAAIALARIGADVVVFEASATPSARGALLLWANALRALAAIECPLAASDAAPIDVTEVRTDHGALLSVLPNGAWSVRAGALSVV